MIKQIIVISAMVALAGCAKENTPRAVEEDAPSATDNRTTRIAEPSFAGFYTIGKDGKVFRECESGKTYWVTGDAKMLQYLVDRFQDVSGDAGESVFVHFRGEKSAPPEAIGGAYDGTLTVHSVIAFRPAKDGDCNMEKSKN